MKLLLENEAGMLSSRAQEQAVFTRRLLMKKNPGNCRRIAELAHREVGSQFVSFRQVS